MTPIEIKRKIESGEPINRAVLAAQAAAQAREIGNGFAVCQGLSMDVIDGILTVDAVPPQWYLMHPKHCFILACMLDSIKVSNEVLDQWLIDLNMEDKIREEKSTKYIMCVMYEHEKAKS